MTSATNAGRSARRLDTSTGTQRPRWLWVLLPALATGCGRDDVRVYEAPKDVKVLAAPAADPHAGITGRELPATPDTPALEWDLPAGWQALPASQMRIGHFAISGDNDQKAELTIIPLLGQAGSDLDNVNRWLAQLGAPPLSAEELARRAEPVRIGGRDGQLFDLAGPEGQAARKRTLAAIQRRDGLAWFYKMTGDDALVTAQKSTLVAFLQTLRFPAATQSAGSADTASQATPPVPVPAAPAAATPPALVRRLRGPRLHRPGELEGPDTRRHATGEVRPRRCRREGRDHCGGAAGRRWRNRGQREPVAPATRVAAAS
ncbi:MAG: hypothetical protein M5U12_00435 [Verrucomicrobia bacterium]|nr:hypothetical protein [Verrucomicrobiota bacterium]